MIMTKDSSVNVTDIHPNLQAFLKEVSDMFDGIVVTSGKDGKHSVLNSRHYFGKALDFGANSSNPVAYANFKKYVLEGRKKWHRPDKFAKYDIEDIIDEGTHIHIELVQTPKELLQDIIKDVKKKPINYAVVGVSIIGIIGYIWYLKRKKVV